MATKVVVQLTKLWSIDGTWPSYYGRQAFKKWHIQVSAYEISSKFLSKSRTL
jgi:hypothetical protein